MTGHEGSPPRASNRIFVVSAYDHPRYDMHGERRAEERGSTTVIVLVVDDAELERPYTSDCMM